MHNTRIITPLEWRWTCTDCENVLGKLKCCNTEGGGCIIMYIVLVGCDDIADIMYFHLLVHKYLVIVLST